VLPAGSRAAATQSIAATDTAASRLGHGGAALVSLAGRSFVHAMHVTTVFSAVIAASGAVLIAMWMPGRRARSRQAEADHHGSGSSPVAVLMED
jgi:DHA2 family integral membrane protein (MFS transporter)